VKFLRYVFIAIILGVVAVTAGTVLSRGHTKDDADRADNSRSILVLKNPIHTDIAIPVDADLLTRFSFLRNGDLDIDHPGLAYLVIGWGGRSFYTETPTWADLKPIPVLKSFTLDHSVMHVALAGDIPLSDESVTPLRVSGDGYRALIDFIDGSFARPQGKPLPLLGKSYSSNDAFFEANGYFNALLGCNTWTAAALRAAGVETGWWTPLPPLLITSLRLHNDVSVLPAQ
jgi:uncharacterized protein (TIGR02117 family)